MKVVYVYCYRKTLTSSQLENIYIISMHQRHINVIWQVWYILIMTVTSCDTWHHIPSDLIVPSQICNLCRSRKPRGYQAQSVQLVWIFIDMTNFAKLLRRQNANGTAVHYAFVVVFNIHGFAHGMMGFVRLLDKLRLFSGGLQHNIRLQHPGDALVVKIVVYVFCSGSILENKVTTLLLHLI